MFCLEKLGKSKQNNEKEKTIIELKGKESIDSVKFNWLKKRNYD